MAGRERFSLEDLASIPDPLDARGAPSPPASPPGASAPSERAPTRAERRRKVGLALALAVGWVALLVYRAGVRRDIDSPEVAAQLGLWTAAGLLALVVAFAPLGRRVPAGVRLLQAVIVGVFVAFLAAAVLGALRQGAEAFRVGALTGCLVLSIVAAAGPLALAALVVRRSFASAPALRGAALGAICGLAGAVGVHAHCPVEMVAHVVVGHGVPVLVGALLGALYGAAVGRA